MNPQITKAVAALFGFLLALVPVFNIPLPDFVTTALSASPADISLVGTAILAFMPGVHTVFADFFKLARDLFKGDPKVSQADFDAVVKEGNALKAQVAPPAHPAQSGRAWLPLVIALALGAAGASVLQGCATGKSSGAPAVTPAQAQAAACQALNAAAPKLQARIPEMTPNQLAAADLAVHTLIGLCTGPAPTSVSDFTAALSKASGDLAAAFAPSAPASAASN
jgi:hypothetical protein